VNALARNVPMIADNTVDYSNWRKLSTTVSGNTRHSPWQLPSPRYLTDPAPLVARFRRLANLWISETINVSILDDVITHPAYQEIIGMGPAAIPLILDELEREPNHWFPALAAISGTQSPVPEEDAGDIDKMTDAWLQWAKENSYR